MVTALNRKLLRDFLGMKAQVVTIALMVACGISIMVASWSSYLALKVSRDSFYREYRFADVFAEIKRAPMDVADRIRAIDGVSKLEARITATALIDVPGQEEPAVGAFVSIAEDEEHALNRVYLRQGRLPQKGTEPEILVHEAFAKAQSLKPGDHLSFSMNGRKREFTISGIAISPEYIYALSPFAPLPDDKHFGVFWMPHSTLEAIMDMSGAFNSIALTLMPRASEDAVKEEIDRILKPYGNAGAIGRGKQLSNMFISDEINQQRVTATFTPSVFLAIAGFLIHVIISRLIAMQRTQIATLKACGYGNGEITFHYAQLVLLMMLVGTIPGLLLGVKLGQWMMVLYQDFFRFPSLELVVSAPAMAVALLAGVVPGLIGALSSIRSVYSMQPAEAMRPPAPPEFQRSLLDLLQVRWGVPVRARMVIRNLLFRPWRLLLSLIGLSAAYAMVILAVFFIDTIDYLLTTQFQMAQREDVSVNFTRVRSLSALNELRGIDGILKVEGYRSLAVRARYRQHEKETAINGRPPGASLRLLLDKERNIIRLPPGGLMASRSFAERWGLQVGSEVEFEPLEGRGRILRLPVVGFTDDLMGDSFYMDLESLWRLLDEQPGYNVAALQVDPIQTGRVYTALKNLPEIAVTNVKTIMYRGFKETIAKTMMSSTWILIAFAVTIAIGITYNSVRVSFSERSWEMASLRILGFKRESVLALLLAEVGVQILIATVPGCALGYYLALASTKMTTTETFNLPLVVEPSTYAIAILVMWVTFGLSALIIRRMLDKLSLSEALKARE